MIVVMAMISVVFAIGISVFVNVRNESYVNNVAEQVASDIRMMQARAMGTQGDCKVLPGDENAVPKMWALKADATNGSIKIYYYCHSEEKWYQEEEGTGDYEIDGIRINNSDPSVIPQRTFVFNAPLGKFFLVDNFDPDAEPPYPIGVIQDPSLGSFGPNCIGLEIHYSPLPPLSSSCNIVGSLTPNTFLAFTFGGKSSANVIIDNDNGTVRIQ